VTSTETGNRRLPLVLIPQPFGSLVFERCTGRYLPFDAAATSLLLTLADETIDAVMGSPRRSRAN
jgi:[mycofactocin precursor peptide]-tyrosine decarboxylase / 3-amino-5-[(4-hydroxyphenyl)methyl]-4,4-dimethylpyrrolidin-2-one synthase